MEAAYCPFYILIHMPFTWPLCDRDNYRGGFLSYWVCLPFIFVWELNRMVDFSSDCRTKVDRKDLFATLRK